MYHDWDCKQDPTWTCPGTPGNMIWSNPCMNRGTKGLIRPDSIKILK